MSLSSLNTNFFDLIGKARDISFPDLIDNLTKDAQFNASSYDVLFREGLVFKQYESLEEAFDTLEVLKDLTNPTATEREARSFFRGIGASNFEEFKQELNKTSSALDSAKEVADSLLGNLKEIINLGGSFKKDRLKVTDDSRGIFDFSLASQGLFRPIEFFSEGYAEYAKDNEDEFANLNLPKGVVPDERVRKDTSKFGVVIYYFVADNGTRYQCVRRQKGATAVFEKFSDVCMLKTNEQGIEVTYLKSNTDKVFNGEGKTRLKYSSTTKKAYLMFERKAESTKYVDIFIPINFLTVSDGNRMFNVLGPLLTASALEDFGIKVRISAMRLGVVGSGANKFFQSISVPVKDYGTPVSESFNTVMNLLGKQSFASTFFAGLKILEENKGEQLSPSGRPLISGENFESLNPYYYLKDANINLFMRYKNWIKENEGKPFVNTKVVNPNFQIFTHQAIQYSEPFYEKRIPLNAKTLAENLPYTMYQFYWYMDFLSIEFNDMKDYVDMLIKRWEEDEVFRRLFVPPKGRGEIKLVLRQYITNILLYKYYSSKDGAYADTPEEAREKEERKTELIKAMDETLKNY